jgi:hypothetical protein
MNILSSLGAVICPGAFVELQNLRRMEYVLKGQQFDLFLM